jgi:Replication-relaxation
VTQTYAMPDVEEISDRWREEHLARQNQVFTRYPEDMSSLAVRDVPVGLDGAARAREPDPQTADAREVAEGTIGRRPEGAPRLWRPRSDRVAPGDDHLTLFDDGDADADEGPPEDGESTAADGAQPVRASERVGGVRIERAEEPEQGARSLVSDSPVLRVACQRTRQPLPDGDLGAATDGARQAVREAAAFEAISRVPEWQTAGDEARKRAAQAASVARDQAMAEADAAGVAEQEAGRAAERRARRAAAEVLAGYGDVPWRSPVRDLELGEADTHTLEVIARLRFASPSLLTQLLTERVRERAIRDRVARLHDAGLVARTEVAIEGRRGRRPRLYAVAPRGLEYLRLRHGELRPDHEPPAYLQPTRKLPSPGKGREVPHELAVQLTVVALRQFDAQVHWHTTRMPGGRWDVGMVHEDRRDRTLRLTDLMPEPGLSVQGEQLDAPPTLDPDLSVQLQGRLGGQRAVIDLLIEVDRTGRGSYNAAKFTGYDHFLGGWSLHTRHWGKERRSRPVVVFVAHSAKAMLALLQGADEAMTLGFGARGCYEPAQFEFPGRAHTSFTCIDWLLAGRAVALRLPTLPPQVRGRSTELRPERVALLPEAWWLGGAHQ